MYKFFIMVSNKKGGTAHCFSVPKGTAKHRTSRKAYAVHAPQGYVNTNRLFSDV